jgi:hypothetical protein
MMFRHQIYQALGRGREAFLRRVSGEARRVGMAEEWKGVIGLTGSNSARPAYLRPDIVAAVAEGARSPKNLIEYAEEIRIVVKQEYGDDYDALPINTCEAALWAALETLAAPPIAGRGDSYRARYVALYEAHGEHQAGYGRPFPPKYKDLFADRANIAGELGVLGRRLNNLDALIVKMAGARYEPHGIKSFIVPLLTSVDAACTRQRLQEVIERHADSVSALMSLGYDSAGYGYGEKRDGVTPDLKVAMGELARACDVPYIVDNARGIPFLGAHPRDMGADLVLFSMDKVAGAPTSGLIVGRPECMIPLQRALGWHSERFGGGQMTYGKGVFAPFDPGREALVGQLASLRWLQENKSIVTGSIDALHAIVLDECRPLLAKYGEAIRISRSYNGGAVEVNYVDTWEGGRIGIPIFSAEDKAAGMNLVSAGVGALGILPPSPDEGNIVVTPGRGLLDGGGGLIEERARAAVRGLAGVLGLLGELAESCAKS